MKLKISAKAVKQVQHDVFGFSMTCNYQQITIIPCVAPSIDPESNPDKWLQYAKELRAGKHNPLKYQGKTVKIKNTDGISAYDLEYLRHELNNNLTPDERKRNIIIRPIGDYIYTIKNNGFDNYEFLGRRPIDDLFDY